MVTLLVTLLVQWAHSAQIWNEVCDKYSSPKLQGELQIPISNENEIQFYSETIPCDSFPEFEELSESPSIFEDVADTLWWTWVKKVAADKF